MRVCFVVALAGLDWHIAFHPHDDYTSNAAATLAAWRKCQRRSTSRVMFNRSSSNTAWSVTARPSKCADCGWTGGGSAMPPN